jgi:hypothetical protein
MDRTINATATQHHLIRRIDNGIHRQRRDITLYHFDFHAHILSQ